MNGRLTSSSQLFSALGIKTPGHLLQKFNTHDQFGKIDIFVRKVTHTGKCRIFGVWMNRLFIR